MPYDPDSKNLCAHAGCDIAVSAHGYCPAHYYRWLKGLPMDPPINRRNRGLAERLLEKIEYDTVGGCWLWSMCRLDHDGYGTMAFKGRNRKAPQLAWEAWRGPIPEGMCVLHTCDVRACINPDHLWLGTQFENDMDRTRKGRTARVFNEKNHATWIPDETIAHMRQLWRAGGITQREIAELVGCAASHVSVVVRGLARP